MKLVRYGIFFLLLVSASIAHAADIYRWVDKNGSPHFTDDIGKVPSEYQDQVKKEEVKEPRESEASKPAPASVEERQKERKDAHGMGETYWRERSRPWNKQLKEATENYENINMDIDDALETAKGRFLTPTQYNFKRIEVEKLMEKRGTYEAKIKEARERLDKIAKEAEEANADPEWLN